MSWQIELITDDLSRHPLLFDEVFLGLRLPSEELRRFSSSTYWAREYHISCATHSHFDLELISIVFVDQVCYH